MSFAEDVEAIRRSIAGGSGGSAAQLRRVQDGLRNIALAGFALGDDVQDVVAETLLRFVTAVLDDRLDPELPAHPYLIQTARDIAARRMRRARALPLDVRTDAEMLTDDDLSSLLDEHASSATVDAGMARARRAGDHDAAKVVAVWLVLAQDLGQAPSLAQTAAAAGLGHDEAAEALTRFGRYIRGESARGEGC